MIERFLHYAFRQLKTKIRNNVAIEPLLPEAAYRRIVRQVANTSVELNACWWIFDQTTLPPTLERVRTAQVFHGFTQAQDGVVREANILHRQLALRIGDRRFALPVFVPETKR